MDLINYSCNASGPYVVVMSMNYYCNGLQQYFLDEQLFDYSGNVYEPCYYVRNGLEW